MAKTKTGKKGRKKGSFSAFIFYAFFVLMLCCLLSALSSCGKTEEPPGQVQKKRITKHKTKKKAVNKTKKPDSGKLSPSKKYSYDATGKPDPFAPLITEAPPQKQEVQQQQTKPLSPLQKYDLKELKLVAIIALGNSSTALLEDPAKYGYIVKDGMLIGKNDGVVKKITENGLIIEEKFYNSMGRIETRISTLTIQHQE